MQFLKLLAAAVLVVATVPLSVSKAGESTEKFQWSHLPELPPAYGETRQAGLAGPFAGVHGGALIVAGGANFPDLPPWKGGGKAWWDDVYVLRKNQEGKVESKWFTSPRLELPKPSAYGVSIPTAKGLVCIGGRDAEHYHSDVLRLQWSEEDGELSIQRLPDLPRPLAFMAGAKVGEVVYLAGGQESKDGNATSNFWALDLSEEDRPNGKLQWKELPTWSGPPRILALAASQNDGKNDCLFLFSGRRPQDGLPTQLLTDTFKYDPVDETWSRLADVSTGDGQPQCVMAGTSLPVGVAHILVFGGADGKRFLEIESLNRRLADLGRMTRDSNATDANSSELSKLKAEHLRFHEEHTGFSNEILSYHVVTDTWTQLDDVETPFPVTTQALDWDGKIVIPTGESSPGIRTTKVHIGQPTSGEGFGALDFFVIGLYLAVLVYIGIRLAKKEKTPEDYFKAGGRIPWWAAGLSIFGTQLSAITFMALPAKAYGLDDCKALRGDSLSQIAVWKKGSDLSVLEGKVVQLHMEIQNADLYSFQFQPWLR